MNHSTRAPTKYEAERIEAMKRLGCVACAVLGIPYADIEVHHILDGNKRMGHWFTIPLCAGHHQGRFTALQRDLMEDTQQVALSDGRKLFNAVYGSERQLWERVQDRLRLPKVWPVSKVLPRRGYEKLFLVGCPESMVGAVSAEPTGSTPQAGGAGVGPEAAEGVSP